MFEIDGDFSTSVGESATLTVSIIGKDPSVVTKVTWTFSDGQTATGTTVTRTYASAGFISFIMKALNAQGEVISEIEGVVTVYDPAAGPNPPIEGFPTVWGDTGANGTFGLDDLLLAAQGMSGVYTLGTEGVSAADVNLSTVLDTGDLRLLASALFAGASLPTAVLDNPIRAFGRTTIVSPVLLDPKAEFEIFVGGFKAPAVNRILLGFAAFGVPGELASASGDVTVEIKIGGNTVDSTTATMAPLPSPSAPPKEDVLKLFDETIAILKLHADGIEDYIAAHGGLSPDDIEVLRAFPLAVAGSFEEFKAEVAELLKGEGGDELAKYLQTAMYANGVTEFRTTLAAAQAEASGQNLLPEAQEATPTDVCGKIVASICLLNTTASGISTVAGIYAKLCAAATITAMVGGAVIPADGPLLESGALAAFVAQCIPLIAEAEFAVTVIDIIKELSGVGISIESDKKELKDPSETAKITGYVEFTGLDNICSKVIDDKLVGPFIAKYIGEKVARRIMLRADVGTLKKILDELGVDIYLKMLDIVQGSTKTLLDTTGISSPLKNLVQQGCKFIRENTVGKGLLADVKDFNLVLSQGGSISYPGDGTALVSCPDPFDSKKPIQKVSATKNLCAVSPFGLFDSKASVDITCGGGNVTITMGDNGSLNDDIFEIIYEGKTVLTSSSPVRSTSVTIPMPKGENTVLMRGRAAPDGVGTYFISFSGATVKSGVTSGTDLTPGVTKTFVIEVQ